MTDEQKEYARKVQRERIAKVRQEDPDRVFGPWLKCVFGISVEEYRAMETSQDGKCKICGTKDPGVKFGKTRLSIDHCHTTGKIRGLLCHCCNLAIGFLKDDISLALKAAEYLRQ